MNASHLTRDKPPLSKSSTVAKIVQAKCTGLICGEDFFFVRAAKKKIKNGKTSMGIRSVGRVVLRVQGVLQVELGVLQHPLNHVLYVDSFRHVWRCHDVERGQAGIGRLGHALDDEFTPQPLLLHRIITLQMSRTWLEDIKVLERKPHKDTCIASADKTIKSTYMIHHCGKFDAVPNVLLQEIQHFHQFVRRKLRIKRTNDFNRSSRPALSLCLNM